MEPTVVVLPVMKAPSVIAGPSDTFIISLGGCDARGKKAEGCADQNKPKHGFLLLLNQVNIMTHAEIWQRVAKAEVVFRTSVADATIYCRRRLQRCIAIVQRFLPYAD